MVKLLFCVCESAILLSHFSSEAQLLNAYSFSELPGRPEKIIRVTCTDLSIMDYQPISSQTNSFLMLQKLE